MRQQEFIQSARKEVEYLEESIRECESTIQKFSVQRKALLTYLEALAKDQPTDVDNTETRPTNRKEIHNDTIIWQMFDILEQHGAAMRAMDVAEELRNRGIQRDSRYAASAMESSRYFVRIDDGVYDLRKWHE